MGLSTYLVDAPHRAKKISLGSRFIGENDHRVEIKKAIHP